MASVTFPTSLGGSGITITDDADPNTGLANSGHRQRFVPALSGAVDMAATSVAKAQEAENFKNLCQQLRDEAETFKNQASTSEDNAATSATLSENWATKLSTPVDGVEYSSKYYANEASISAASVDANNIVHAPGSGLPNEAGTAAAEDAVTDENDDTPSRLVTNARLYNVVSIYTVPPGPQELIAGDMTNGFFGEVASSDLFTNQELDFLLGFTEGTPMNDSAWLKFARNGQIIYVQKRPMRHSISWDHIYSRGCVYGTNDDGLFPTSTPTNQYRLLYKNEMRFIPRLLTGAASDPIDATNYDAVDSCTYDLGAGSEWNELIYRVNQDVPICDDPDHDQYHGGPQVGGNWASYTNADLGILSGDGFATWTQEKDSNSTIRHIVRGRYTSVASFSRVPTISANSFLGLRLVLALK